MSDKKMTNKVPVDWHRKLKIEAALRGMTITKVITISVDEWLMNNPRSEDPQHAKEKV